MLLQLLRQQLKQQLFTLIIRPASKTSQCQLLLFQSLLQSLPMQLLLLTQLLLQPLQPELKLSWLNFAPPLLFLILQQVLTHRAFTAQQAARLFQLLFLW